MRCYRRIRYLMGSPFAITAFGEREACSEGMEEAFSEIARIERLLSVYRPDSELSRVNRFSVKGYLPLHSELLEILSKSLDYARRSGGAFDPTAGPWIRLWGFGPGKERRAPPGREEIERMRERVGFQYLEVDLPSGRARLLQDGMELNLGGVGKGYAVDRAAAKLKIAGVSSALVSCGSAIYAFGSPPGREGWRVEIRRPRGPGGRIGTVSLRDRALGASGDYEKFFMHRGRRYGHLIDPRTGYPAEGVAGAGVVAPTAMEADALSTALFVLGGEEGKKLLARFPGAEGWIVEEREGALRTYSSSGWRFEAERLFSRRRFLGLAAALLAGLILPFGAGAAVVYLTEEEALRKMMPDADRFDTEEVRLTSDQLAEAQRLAGRRFREEDFRFRVGRREKETVGYALTLEVIGKERPITFLIGLEPSGAVKGVEILIYRESEGSAIRYPRFMDQFSKKKMEDPLRLGQDIQPISGATLSSRAAVYAVRKALALFEVTYRKTQAGPAK